MSFDINLVITFTYIHVLLYILKHILILTCEPFFDIQLREFFSKNDISEFTFKEVNFDVRKIRRHCAETLR